MKIWVISDLHCGHRNIEKYCNRPAGFESIVFNNLIKWKKANPNDVLINLGDFCFKDYKKWIKIWNDILKDTKTVLVKGNHDPLCVSKKTRLLTKNGYKYYNEISKGDIIPSVNLETGKIDYKPIKDIYIYKTKKLYVAKTARCEMELTKKHTIINKYKQGKWEKNTTENLWHKKGNFKVPVSFSSNTRYNISNNHLKLIAWIMSDGGITKYNQIVIYQSKEKTVKEIRDLLNDTGLNFRETVRNRNITHIMGKKLKSCLPAHEFYVDSNQSREFLKKYNYESKYKIPDFLWELSDVQFNIFLDVLIKADGSVLKKGTCAIWGKKSFLEDILGLCVTHNKSANLFKQKTRNHYYLSLYKRNTGKVFRKDQKHIIEYNDLVWCVNVDNHTVFMELNGKPFVTGNSAETYLKDWNFVCDDFSITYRGKKILFTHKPNYSENYDFNVHGHCHLKIPTKKEGYNQKKQKLVSLEKNYKPICLNELIK